MIRIAHALAALAASSMPAFSQGFNVDFFSNSPVTVPSAAFGAASGQVGTWNGLDCFYCEPQVFPLVDLAGQPTSVDLQMVLAGQGQSCTDSTLTSDEQALLRSGQLCASTYNDFNARVSGLASGFYDVFVYAGLRCGPFPTTYITTSIGIQPTTGNVFGIQLQNSEGNAVQGQGPFQERGNYVRFRLRVESGQALIVHLESLSNGWFSAHGMQIVPVPGSIVPACFASNDSFGCPCGVGLWARGCSSSLHTAGAGLAGAGSTSVSSDSLVLAADSLSNSTVTFFQGTSLLGQGSGAPFGDGLRCAGGSLVRLAAKLTSAGMASYPGPGDAPISVRGLVPAAGGTRTYQVLYRDPATFCTAATFNATNAVSVTWSP